MLLEHYAITIRGLLALCSRKIASPSSRVHAFKGAVIFRGLWSRDIFQPATGPERTTPFSGGSNNNLSTGVNHGDFYFL